MDHSFVALRRAWGRYFLMSLTVAALLGVSAPAAAVPASCPFGVNAHLATNPALDLAAAAGIGWVRMDMNWFQTEPTNNTYNWTEADRFINHATSLGLNVFVTVAYTPSWAVGAPCNDADPNEVNWCHNRVPANGTDWTDFVTEAVTRYGATVKAWGMWNEPNLIGFFNGTRDQYVNQILVPGSAAVHAACTDCLVLGPELANLRSSSNWDVNEGTCAFGGCTFNAWNYSLAQILQVAGSSIDVITHHKYDDPATGWWASAVDGDVVVIQIMYGIKEITDMWAPGKPVWLTEFGWESEPDGPHTNTYAAAQLTELYMGFDMIRSGTYPGVMNQPWPELEKMFWYDLNDDPNGFSWGLLASDLSIKEPYNAYASVITALGGCPLVPPGTDAGVPGSDGGTTGSDAGGPGTDGGVGPGTDGGVGPGNDGGAGSDATADGGPSNPPGDGCGCVVGRDSGRTPPAEVPLAFALVAMVAATRRRRPRVG